MIVSTYLESGLFGGNYPENEIPKNRIIAPILYSGNFLKPFFNNGNWIESATSEEIDAYNDSLYPLTITALQFKLELVYSGLKVEVESALNSLEEPNKTIAWLYYDKSTEFDRKNNLIQDLGAASGMTKQDINEFFKRAYER